MTHTPGKLKRSPRRRLILIRAMGGVCEYCRDVTDPEKLEFHHTEPRTWKSADVARWTRQARYEAEYLEGKLRLACADCNKALGEPGADDTPF